MVLHHPFFMLEHSLQFGHVSMFTQFPPDGFFSCLHLVSFLLFFLSRHWRNMDVCSKGLVWKVTS